MVSNAGPSFFGLLFPLLRSLAVIVLPLAVAALIPLAWGVVAVTALFALTIAISYWRRPVAKAIDIWISGAVLGVALHLWLIFHWPWGLALAIATVATGFGLQASMERRLKLVRPRGGVSGGQLSDDYYRRGQTPEGETFRVIDAGEIAMGGPQFYTVLFPDGVLLQGIGVNARFSHDGRYFAAQLPARSGDGLLVLDRRLRCVYRDEDHSGFWEIDEFSSSSVPNDSSGPLTVMSLFFQDFLKEAQCESLLPVVDLWLEPGYWQEKLAAATHKYVSPDGQHNLLASLYLPPSLRELEDPFTPIWNPSYTLRMDEICASLMLNEPDSVLWGVDSLGLVCRARATSESVKATRERYGFWLWQQDRGWRELPAVWVQSAYEPQLTQFEATKLEYGVLWCKAVLPNPEISGESHGYSVYSICSKTVTEIGHEADGQMKLAGYPCQFVWLRFPLESPGGRGSAHIETDELVDGQHATFTWDHDNPKGLGAWRCHMGEWALPGLWLLDHRISDCRKYIALCPWPDSARVAGSFQVATLATRTLQAGPDMLVSGIQDFYQDTVSVIEIAGRLEHEDDSGPGVPMGTALAPYETPAPYPGDAEAFLDEGPSVSARPRFYFRLRRFRINAAGSIQSIPSWRTTREPQAANADGDFLYSSPDSRDAAWYFGAATQYGSGWTRPDEPRMGGFLLTASGYAVGDLAPPMLWSESGSLLALCRLVEESDGKNARQWRLLLLNSAVNTLHVGEDSLGGMPEFVSFDEQGLTVRVYPSARRTEGERGHLKHFSLSYLTAMPSKSLMRKEGLSLEPEQESARPLWQQLDKEPLKPWISHGVVQ